MIKPVANRQIAEEAAEWVVRIDSGPLEAAEREMLARWLTASPLHVDELLYSASIMGGLQGIDIAGSPSIDQILSQFDPQVVPLFGQERAAETKAFDKRTALARRAVANARSRMNGRWAALAASLAFVLVATLAIVRLGVPDVASEKATTAQADETYSTQVGEQRSIALEDGSILYMNADSRVTVSLTGAYRRIDLLRGEALFDVAHDPRRPFRVVAGDTVAQAVGTQFNVKRTPDGIRVVVVEGKVLVNSRTGERGSRKGPANTAPAPDRSWDNPPVLLLAGQQAQVEASKAAPLVSNADLVAATSWRTRQLSFDGEGLAAIANEFNRYNRAKIVLSDTSLARLRLSGVFDANDPESFIAFLELSAGVRVDRSQAGQIVVRPAGDDPIDRTSTVQTAN
jgi:transmembrane sensor